MKMLRLPLTCLAALIFVVAWIALIRPTEVSHPSISPQTVTKPRERGVPGTKAHLELSPSITQSTRRRREILDDSQWHTLFADYDGNRRCSYYLLCAAAEIAREAEYRDLTESDIAKAQGYMDRALGHLEMAAEKLSETPR